jgi:hypothetical protein
MNHKTNQYFVDLLNRNSFLGNLDLHIQKRTTQFFTKRTFYLLCWFTTKAYKWLHFFLNSYL